MNSQNFIVMGRPRLAEITKFPKMDFANYERRPTWLQAVLQLIQHRRGVRFGDNAHSARPFYRLKEICF